MEGKLVRINYVLIDFENVQPTSLAALERDDVRVVVFVGANQTKISLNVAESLQPLGRHAEYVRISGNGKNALDFHIAYYIGKLAAEDATAYFHIVSRDSGFEPLIQHLKSQNILAARSDSIENILLPKASAASSPEARAQLYIENLKRPKVTRPRTLKSLCSAIAAAFQKQLTDAEVEAVVQAMQEAGALSITDGKTAYIGALAA